MIFCDMTHIFSVDAGAGREVKELAPSGILCTAEGKTPLNGFISVFESIKNDEGCSRFITAGNIEGMVKYADFDRCEWTSHSN